MRWGLHLSVLAFHLRVTSSVVSMASPALFCVFLLLLPIVCLDPLEHLSVRIFLLYIPDNTAVVLSASCVKGTVGQEGKVKVIA